jgi:hypothetical protein
MALIMEVVDSRGGNVRSRIRLDALPVRIGRGLDNDIILDDPYVDAQHAQITYGMSGEVIVEDLASTNGVALGRGRERVTSVGVLPGMELRIGRTVLRFRDSAEPVAPTLLDAPRAARGGPAWAAKPGAQLALAVVALAWMWMYFWLESYEQAAASDTFTQVLGIAVLGAVWSGIWAVAGRMVVQKFRFMAHFAFFSLILLVILVAASIGEWITFLFPDNGTFGVVGTVLVLVLIAAAVAGHLRLASALSAGRRWKVGAAVSMVLVALLGVGTLTMEDTFSDIPEFASTVKAIGGGWLPTHSVAEFENVTAELQREVDALLEK